LVAKPDVVALIEANVKVFRNARLASATFAAQEHFLFLTAHRLLLPAVQKCHFLAAHKGESNAVAANDKSRHHRLTTIGPIRAQ
jgi:hypothetical protein